MLLDDVIAQPPVLRESEDDRVRFYLQNRDVIEAWAALRREAAAAIANALLDLVEPLQDDLARLGEQDVQVAVDESRGRQSVAITRLGWHRAHLGSPVQVAIETEAQPIGSTGTIQVYTCVRAKQGHPEAEAYRERLNSLSKPLRTTMGRGWQTSQPRFLAWKYIQGPAEGWDLAGIVVQARDEVLRLWAGATPLIDGVMVPSDGLSASPAAREVDGASDFAP